MTFENGDVVQGPKGWHLIVPVPDDFPAPHPSFIQNYAPSDMSLMRSHFLRRTVDHREVRLGFIARYATPGASTSAQRTTLYYALFEQPDTGKRRWDVSSKSAIIDAAEKAALLEVDDLWDFPLPPPWRETDDQADRDAIAALIPEGCDRAAFLDEVKRIAWRHSVIVAHAAGLGEHTGKLPSAERTRARKGLKNLRQSLQAFERTIAALEALSPLASERLQAAVDDGVDATWMAQVVPQVAVRVPSLDEHDKGENEKVVIYRSGQAAVLQIARLAQHAEDLASRAHDSIKDENKGGNQPIQDSVTALARALWAHGNRRPTRANNAARGQSEHSAVNKLAKLVIDPILVANGQHAVSYTGYARRAIEALKAEQR